MVPFLLVERNMLATVGNNERSSGAELDQDVRR